MNELQPESIERKGNETLTEHELKLQEARNIAGLAGVLCEGAEGKESLESLVDGGLDYLYHICKSLGRRDPEMAALLIDALDRDHRTAGHAQPLEIKNNLREQLGLPPLA
ncbi:hypothetical protein M8542_14495 [Amycolatopsis sp. OK19-0408]|uniref:Uncharacterized protein n=1 Tax=Amycolatopsis iheyensis TaxID=2945988 RepID=A0A9X2SL15_9PSEU|nr:hypothetical protein [Amycolatopsis iheyensis]MCR6484030.1 hypothetical protein [Amycolatopsis iheyensis]